MFGLSTVDGVFDAVPCFVLAARVLRINFNVETRRGRGQRNVLRLS